MQKPIPNPRDRSRARTAKLASMSRRRARIAKSARIFLAIAFSSDLAF